MAPWTSISESPAAAARASPRVRGSCSTRRCSRSCGPSDGRAAVAARGTPSASSSSSGSPAVSPILRARSFIFQNDSCRSGDNRRERLGRRRTPPPWTAGPAAAADSRAFLKARSGSNGSRSSPGSPGRSGAPEPRLLVQHAVRFRHVGRQRFDDRPCVHGACHDRANRVACFRRVGNPVGVLRRRTRQSRRRRTWLRRGLRTPAVAPGAAKDAPPAPNSSSPYG